MINAVPVETPVATPKLPLPEIPATPGLLLLQVPPAVVSSKVVVLPWHILTAPAIGATSGFTSIGYVAVHPAGEV